MNRGGRSTAKFTDQEVEQASLSVLEDKLQHKAYMNQIELDRNQYIYEPYFKKGISKQQIASVKVYTDSSFYEVNKGLREGNPEPHIKRFAEVLDDTLDKMPMYKGKVYRGIKFMAKSDWEKIVEQYKNAKGGDIQYDAFLSTTRDKNETAKFKGKNSAEKFYSIEYEIESVSGRKVDELSEWKSEQEVLFKTGSTFEITDVRGVNESLVKVKLKEVY